MHTEGRSRAVPRPTLAGLAAALLALLPLAAPNADATTVVRLSEEQLIDGAQLVVVATCRKTATKRAGGRLVTHAEVEVEEALKGRAGHRLTVVLPGGVDRDRVPPVAEVWAGAPTLAVGERAMLFLRPASERGTWSLVGFSQGKLTVAPSLDDGSSARGRAAALAERVRSRAGGGVLLDAEVTP